MIAINLPKSLISSKNWKSGSRQSGMIVVQVHQATLLDAKSTFDRDKAI